MTDRSDQPVSARLPSHLGLRPPSDSMNASVSSGCTSAILD
jgi:hypothetical protein